VERRRQRQMCIRDRHRIVRNFRAEAEGITADQVISAICG
jgi:hypothetical protein